MQNFYYNSKMIKKKIIGILTVANDCNIIIDINKRIYNELVEEFDEVYIINLKNLLFIKKKRLIKKIENKNIKYFEPRNVNQFHKFFKKKKLIAFNGLGKSFNFFKIFFHLNKIEICQILLLNLGYPQNTTQISTQKKKFIFSFFYFLNSHFSKFLFKSLCILKFFPKIDFYFDARKEIIQNINKSFYRKLENEFNFFDFSYFKKALLINSRSFDESCDLKSLSNKYITFVDSNFTHLDRIVREGRVEKKIIFKYYKSINELLDKLKQMFKKQIIICVHPSSKISELKKYFPNYTVTKFQTSEYIRESKIVLFHESSAALDAIILNKNLVVLESQLLGDYISKRTLTYKNLLKLHSLNLDKNLNIDKEKFLNHISKSKKNNKVYINKNLNADGKLPGYKKILKTMKFIFDNY